MVKTGDDYRAANRRRMQRFYERQRQEGKKRMSIMLSGDVYGLLADEKERTGTSVSDLIERAVLDHFSGPGGGSQEHSIPPSVQSRLGQASATLPPEAVPQGDDGIPNCRGRDLTTQELVRIP
jgi:hypothetical protein